MTTSTIKTVDFVPEYSITGDIRKVSEYDFASYNSKLFPVHAILLMPKGSNQLFPEMGLRETLMGLSHCEEDDIETVFNAMTSHIKQYTGTEVSISLNETTSDIAGSGLACVEIQVSGVPAALTVSVNGSKGILEVQHPSLFK